MKRTSSKVNASRNVLFICSPYWNLKMINHRLHRRIGFSVFSVVFLLPYSLIAENLFFVNRNIYKVDYTDFKTRLHGYVFSLVWMFLPISHSRPHPSLTHPFPRGWEAKPLVRIPFYDLLNPSGNYLG